MKILKLWSEILHIFLLFFYISASSIANLFQIDKKDKYFKMTN